MTKKKTRSSLCNPVMFSTVMKDEELFRGLLARILPERKVRSLRLRDRDDEDRLFETKALLHTEHSIIINPYAKSVRFDVLFEDDDTWFDVECQATDTHDLPQRSRGRLSGAGSGVQRASARLRHLHLPVRSF